MRRVSLLFSFIFLYCIGSLGANNGVALVLSGGGARGFVHLGVIQALEDYDIPIDYIVGTSMGGILGAMYASGYTVEEIVDYIKSDDFRHWSTGEYESQYNFYYKKLDPDSEIFGINFNINKGFQFSLPTNFIPPYQMDLALMRIFAQSSAAAGYNFDSLMIPVRALSYDAYSKRAYVPSSGDLASVIRASMSFPGIFKPTVIDSMLLFDGGIINNFPVDVAIHDFNPAFILGSNCSYNYDKPTEDDVISHITSLTSSPTNFDIPDSLGMRLDFDLFNLSLLDFDKIDSIMAIGYNRTMSIMPQIQERVTGRISAKEMSAKRMAFKSKLPPLEFRGNALMGIIYEDTSGYMRHQIEKKDNERIDFEQLKEHYFDIVSDGVVNTFYPTAHYNEQDSVFDFSVRYTRQPSFRVGLGGTISSVANLAFLSLNYYHPSPMRFRTGVNVYFGSAYNSQKLFYRFDTRLLTSNRGVFHEGMIIHSTYDYYKNNPDVLFSDTRPDFMNDKELFGQFNIGTPLATRNSVLRFGITVGQKTSQYYTTKDFTSKDIPELSLLDFTVVRLVFEKNKLNYKMFPTKGVYQMLALNGGPGRETHQFGSTSPEGEQDSLLIGTRKKNEFQRILRLRFQRIQYFKPYSFLSLGYHLEAVYSSQNRLSDYYSTLLFLPAFQPMPNIEGLFQERYTSSTFVAAGVIPTFTKGNLMLRLEAYGFMPFYRLSPSTNTNERSFYSSQGVKNIFWQGGISLIYQTIIGPFSVAAHYYDRSNTNWFFSINFGYYLFNKRALD